MASWVLMCVRTVILFFLIRRWKKASRIIFFPLSPLSQRTDNRWIALTACTARSIKLPICDTSLNLRAGFEIAGFVQGGRAPQCSKHDKGFE
jgi:hypothetical protein